MPYLTELIENKYLKDGFEILLKNCEAASLMFQKMDSKTDENTMIHILETFGFRVCKEHFTLFFVNPKVNVGFYVSRCNCCIDNYQNGDD
jgi:hypothetical protein